ncbi:hypothetical protein DEU56DRAFT_761825 [Suillus clintonianus]|uniref:uncharacterized protein n=1 Tax=Suillus clintonianus TaxID=1904413 RepID=UPI001B87A54F|nr:uncharacterized protein DEU56DRAFT_761825 [Suillus clintonianus]KAG2114411.1 hypothetical protein DEU56DRAFT_761825 [Suillus clintonianus]
MFARLSTAFAILLGLTALVSAVPAAAPIAGNLERRDNVLRETKYVVLAREEAPEPDPDPRNYGDDHLLSLNLHRLEAAREEGHVLTLLSPYSRILALILKTFHGTRDPPLYRRSPGVEQPAILATTTFVITSLLRVTSLQSQWNYNTIQRFLTWYSLLFRYRNSTMMLRIILVTAMHTFFSCVAKLDEVKRPAKYLHRLPVALASTLFRLFRIRVEIVHFFVLQYEALVKFRWTATSATASCTEVDGDGHGGDRGD